MAQCTHILGYLFIFMCLPRTSIVTPLWHGQNERRDGQDANSTAKVNSTDANGVSNPANDNKQDLNTSHRKTKARRIRIAQIIAQIIESTTTNRNTSPNPLQLNLTDYLHLYESTSLPSPPNCDTILPRPDNVQIKKKNWTMDMFNGDWIENLPVNSITNICHGQCMAKCVDDMNQKDFRIVEGIEETCQLCCQSYYPTGWIEQCADVQCITSCRYVTDEDDIGNRMLKPAKPEGTSWSQVSPREVMITWVTPTVPTLNTVHYVIEHDLGRGAWKLLDMITDTSYTASRVDVCSEISYRVASVNQYGSWGFSDSVTRSVLPKPGPVRMLHIEPPFFDTIFETFVSIYVFETPEGWSWYDIASYDITGRTNKTCRANAIPPEPLYYIDELDGRDGASVLEARVLDMAYGCAYTAPLAATSRCKVIGDPLNITMDLTDCDIIEDYVCPFVHPDPVTNAWVNHTDGNMTVAVSWERPQSLGTSDSVALYVVQWGIHLYGAIGFPKFMEEGIGNVTGDQTSMLITLNRTEVTYGVKIMPLVQHHLDQFTVDEIHNQLDIAKPLVEFEVKEVEAPEPTDPLDPEKPGENNATNNSMIVLYIFAPIAIIACLVLTTIYYRHHKYKLNKQKSLSTIPITFNNVDRHNQQNRFMVDNPFYIPQIRAGDLRAPPDHWEIERKLLVLGQVLGRGAFGEVVKGSIKATSMRVRKLSISSQVDEETQELTVAVKMLLAYAEGTHKQDFLKEIDLMKSIGHHPNVVSMVGCCTQSDPLCLIVEHAPNGDLLHYLRNHRMLLQKRNNSISKEDRLTIKDLLSYSRQVAVGMEFLSQKGFVHRDLACRNVLVGYDNVIKIGDFGLTRYIYDDKIYVTRKGGKLPLKWMAIESIFDLTFTTATDVWSFGVVLFEIITLGGTPYPTVPNKDLLKELKNGYRMEKPDNCTDALYSLMSNCWQVSPEDRPTFTHIRQKLENQIQALCTAEYVIFDLDQNKDYYTHNDDATDDIDNMTGTENTITSNQLLLTNPSAESLEVRTLADSGISHSDSEMTSQPFRSRKKKKGLRHLTQLSISTLSRSRSSEMLSVSTCSDDLLIQMEKCAGTKIILTKSGETKL